MRHVLPRVLHCKPEIMVFGWQAGQAPTHQIIKEARLSGFDNVHDFLIHQATGETDAYANHTTRAEREKNRQ